MTTSLTDRRLTHQRDGGVVTLIGQAYANLTAQAQDGRTRYPDWERFARRAVGATARFKGDRDAGFAIQKAYLETLQEAAKLGPIVKVHRPFFWGDSDGFRLEFAVDALKVSTDS